MKYEMRRLWFDGNGRVGAGWHYVLPATIKKTKVTAIVLGSGEFVTVTMADYLKAEMEPITRSRARKALKRLIERRRVCSQPPSPRLRTLYDSYARAGNDTE